MFFEVKSFASCTDVLRHLQITMVTSSVLSSDTLNIIDVLSLDSGPFKFSRLCSIDLFATNSRDLRPLKHRLKLGKTFIFQKS